MPSRPTTGKRKSKQRTKEQYAKAREAAQLAGVIPTIPEGAVRDERVDPATQDEQRFPGLDRLAIREGKGWGVNEHIKRKVIETSAEVLFEKKTYFDTEGNEKECPPDRAAQAQAARTLLAAEKMEMELAHADDKPPGINIDNTVNVVTWDSMAQPPKLQQDPVEKRIEAIVEAAKNKQEV